MVILNYHQIIELSKAMKRKDLKLNILERITHAVFLIFMLASSANAQDTLQTKTKFGTLFGTNICWIANNSFNLTHSAHGGLFYSYRMNKRFSLYHELSITHRDYRKFKINETTEGKYSVINLRYIIAPEFRFNKYMSVLIGYGYDKPINPTLGKSTNPIDIKKEVNNYDMILFEYRLSYKDIGFGFRYDIGLTSPLRSVNDKIQVFTINAYLNLNKLCN